MSETTITETVKTTIIKAHTVTEHLTLAYAYPAHEPRKGDVHYVYFNQARARLKQLGLLKCWICGATEGVELHHNACEFALSQAVDWEKFAADHLDWHISSDEDFQRMIEGEGALMPLCILHHRGIEGIHTIHMPAWSTLKYLKEGALVPEQAVRTAHP
jgi:hypothetical protein